MRLTAAMTEAARPSGFFLAALLGLSAPSASGAGAEASPRVAPTRPNATATAPVVGGIPATPAKAVPALRSRKFGKIDYVKLADGAAQLGLKLTKSDRGRRVVLRGPGVSAEIEQDTRDVTVNGVRVLLGDKTEDARGEIYVSRADYERCLAPMLKPGVGATLPLPGTKVVVLDPGHGGRDNGTSLKEKVYALDVALRAKKLLQAAGFRVVMTREDDVYLSLAERPAIALANKADLFVSIHFNAIGGDTKTAGVEVYTFPPQHQRGTAGWSPGEKDNSEDEAAPVNRFDYWSNVLAHAIHRRFVRDLKVFDRGKKLMHLGVLRSLRCPGVLVECGFLTSEAEAKKISTAAYRDELAATIVKGVREYAATVEAVRKRT